MRSICISLSLLAPPAFLGAQDIPSPQLRETAFISYFQEINPQIVSFRTFFKKDLDGRHTLILVVGSAGVPPADVDNSELRYAWWNENDLLGVFLASSADPNQVWNLAIIANSPDYLPGRVEVDRVDTGSLVLRLFVSDYGLPAEWLKLFFDTDSKRLVGQVRYSPVGFGKIVFYPFQRVNERPQGRLYFLGNSGTTPVAAAWDWGSAEPILIPEAEAREVLGQLSGSERRYNIWGTSGAFDSDRQIAYWDNSVTLVPIDFEGRFSVSIRAGEGSRTAEGVAERTEEGYKMYLFPQSSLEEHRRARPERDQQQGRTVDWTIEEKIGPYQITDRFWFAKTFYDGEGNSGVGGLGYFDQEQKRFVIFSPPALAPWAASSLTVIGDVVWVGLVRNPEGGEYSGGLLRFEPATGNVVKYEMKELVLAISPMAAGATVALGTTNGIYLLRGEMFQRFVIEPDLDGNFQVISADLPE